jgi:OHCU decarboxylase
VTITVPAFDALPAERAAELLRACCGASRWVATVVSRRPYGRIEPLLDMADKAWWAMGEEDWREAFAHHPRIGEWRSEVPQDARGAAWSAAEQTGATRASTSVQAELAAVNREYEERFGHIYIVFASGRSAEELLEIARERLQNSPWAELRVAAEEQRKITRLRMQKLFTSEA